MSSARETAPGLLRLALPAMVSQLGLVAMGVVDVMLAGSLGATAIAAVGLGHLWGWGTFMIVIGTTAGLDPFLTQAFGARDPKAVGRAMAHGAGLLGLLTIPVVLIQPMAGPVLLAFGQPPEVVEGATAFVHALAWGIPPLVAFGLVRQMLQADGRMTEATVVIFAGNVVNFVLAWALSQGRLGLPDLGLGGIGTASATARWVMALALIVIARRPLGEAAIPWALAFDFRAVARLATTALPVGFQIGLEVWAFNAAALIAGQLGAHAGAANTVAINAASATFMIPLGLSMAAATRVGNAVGAGLPWRHIAKAALGLTVLVQVPSTLLFALGPTLVAGAFTDDPGVLALAATVLPVAGAFQLFDGLQVVMFGILRGRGDTRLPSLANVVGYWFVGLPIAAYLSHPDRLGLIGVWIALSLALVLVTVLLGARLATAHRR